MNNVAVVGSGIAGISAAYELAKAGFKVTVIEAEPYAAMKTSYANGGQVSVSNSEVWNSWSNVKKAIKWMGTKDAPLLIRPSLDWDKAMWIAKFLITTASNDSVRYTSKTIQLGLEARKRYDEIIAAEKIQFDQSKCGILHFYKNQEYFDHSKAFAQVYEAAGCEWKVLHREEVSKIEPTLQNRQDIIGGGWTPSDWTGDIHKYCSEMKTVLEDKYGVVFVFDRRIEDPSELDNFDRVVLCNGVDASRMTKKLGDKQLVYPVKGYSITITVNEEQVYNLPRTSLLDDQAKIVTATLGNRFRVAGTAELAGHNYDIRRDRIEPLLNWVHINFPKIDTRNYSQWACLRPMTPNMMPIVKRSKNPKFYYHFGHGHLGWTLSPATAQHLVKLMENDQ